MSCRNFVALAGNVGGKIVFGKTRYEDPACSFSVSTEDGSGRTIWVRVNAYSDLAIYCQDKIEKGIFVSVFGELMNRDGKCGELTEIRATDIVPTYCPKDKEDKENTGDSRE